MFAMITNRQFLATLVLGLLMASAALMGRSSQIIATLNAPIEAAPASTSPVSAPAAVSDTQRRAITQSFGNLPLYFVENRGQLSGEVSHYIRGKDKSIYFTPQGVTFVLTSARATAPPHHRTGLREANDATTEHSHSDRWIVKLDFLDANPTKPQGIDRTRAVVSYFKGEKQDWKAGLPTYQGLQYKNLWSDIDLAYEGAKGSLKYTFTLAPGANPDHIRLAYRGAENVSLSDSGALTVATPAGNLNDAAPIAWQVIDGKRIDVPVKFTLDTTHDDKNIVGFALGHYDPSQPLTLDPAVIVYAGFIGGSDDDSINSIAIDSAGYAYVTGRTLSTEAQGFPVTVGPDLTHNGAGFYDAFVAKVRADGSGLVYAGYIGGSANDYGQSIAIDSAGNVYVAGRVNSTPAAGFPVTVGPRLTMGGGNGDGYIAKINPSGTALVYCGYMGGNGLTPTDAANALSVAVDSSGSAYVVGRTASTDVSFPMVGGPSVTFGGGQTDGYIAKVSADGTGFVYRGYIGGNGDDGAGGVAVDAAGSAYVVGFTTSTNLATNPGLNNAYGGGTGDGYVVKVSPSGSSLVYGGYIGGTGQETAFSVAIDAGGNAYVVGLTDTADGSFPVTAGSFSTTYNGGLDDGYLVKINVAGTGFVYSTFLGGSGEDWALGVAVDANGNAYVSGYTASPNFPVKSGPQLAFNGGPFDAFVTRVNASGSTLGFSGYLGGSGDDYIDQAIALDAAGYIYVGGGTSSTEATFPVVIGPDLTYNGGIYDAFVAKIGIGQIQVPSTTISFGTVAVIGSATQTVTVSNVGNGTLAIGAIGALAAPFSVSSGSCLGSPVLAVGASCTVVIAFSPTVPNLTSTTTLVIPSDDPDVGTANGQDTLTVTISGTGVNTVCTQTAAARALNAALGISTASCVAAVGGAPPTGGGGTLDVASLLLLLVVVLMRWWSRTTSAHQRGALLLVLGLLPVMAIAADSDFEDLRVLVQHKDYRQAYALAESQSETAAGIVAFDYLYGTAALETEHYSEAAFAFERVLLNEPDNYTTRIALARAYRLGGQLDLARALLNTILGSVQDPAILAQARAELGVLVASGQRIKWTGAVEFSTGYDNNINAATSLSQLPQPSTAVLILDPAGGATPDGYARLDYRLGGERTYGNGGFVLGGFEGFQNRNFSEHRFDTTYAGVVGGGGYSDPDMRVLMYGTYQRLYIDHAGFLYITGPSIEWRHRIGERSQFGMSATYIAYRYDALTEHNTDAAVLVAGWRQVLAMRTRPELLATIFYGDERARDQAYDYYGRRFGGLELKTTFSVGNKHRPYVQLRWQTSIYDDVDPIYAPQTRTDDYLHVGIGWHYRWDPQIEFGLEAVHTRNDSTIALYSFDRNRYSFTTRYEWR